MGRGENIGHKMRGAIQRQVRLSTSKRTDRAHNDGRAQYIHSESTRDNYKRVASEYGRWLSDRGMRYCGMDTAREHAREYIERGGTSPSTQAKERSALARVFSCRGEDICDIEPRRGREITRGRRTDEERERDDCRRDDGRRDRAAEAERTPQGREIAEACRASGLRHYRELEQLRASDLRYDEDGSLRLHVVGKGGRERDALVLDGPGRDAIERRAAAARDPDERLFSDCPHHLNVHACRADYAAAMYAHALETGHGSGEYYRPHDGSGDAWDKGALDYVSEQLGHGEGRYYTVVYNYLSYGRA